MAWKIMWTESAWIDLENIARYIAEDSPYYAASFVREIKEAARSLEHFAERGRIHSLNKKSLSHDQRN